MGEGIIQGEIDVVGIDVNARKIYVCEVAVHLITGLQYVKDKKPNNVDKLFDKFCKDIDYANKFFDGYRKEFMFWSPIVKNQGEQAKYNQLNDILEVKKKIKDKYNLEIVAVINEKFINCLDELRNFAKTETKDIKSSIIRLYQIEEYTKAHIEKLNKLKE
ncbi:MAG TPA: hypothetical protein PL163_15415 [Leptospiraceae bacterium]|nr:hypothetical protein [Leptospiraceae bacterium]HNI95888.1 hypothetical protein [Leptospiraceae bacterium]HNM06490.1 hypothetical protein [Leptospiraceae bacterium]